MRALVELIFLVERHANLFVRDLVEVMRAELNDLDVASTVSETYMPARPGLIHVVMSATGWRWLAPVPPTSQQWARSLLVCFDQPNSAFFERELSLAPGSGGIFDINPTAIDAWRHHGFEARPFQLGYSRYWDESAHHIERDIDVIVLSGWTARRARYLASYAPSLWRFRSQLLLNHEHRPHWDETCGYLAGPRKWERLARSKVLVNLHRGDEPYFEWLRIAEAISNGCTVVSEPSQGFEPLEPGEHFLVGRPEVLGHLAMALVEDERFRGELQAAAREVLKERLPMSAAVAQLANAAEELDKRTRHLVRSDRAAVPRPPVADDDPRLSIQPFVTTDDPDAAVLRAAAKQTLLELTRIRRAVERLAASDEPAVRVAKRSRAYGAGRPRVSVLMTLWNLADLGGAALDSIAASTYGDFEIVVVDDASTDGSVEVVERWIDHHSSVAALLVRHAYNKGLVAALNTAIDFARGELCFVIDADDEVYPPALERLVDALDADAGADFAYCMVERHRAGEAEGLGSQFPWCPELLRHNNYIAAPALLRKRALYEVGRYRDDPYGVQDYDLWCRFAEADRRGTFVPEILYRYRISSSSMMSTVSVSLTTMFATLRDRYPKLMKDLVLPL